MTSTQPAKRQWDCFLENLGEWEGSFTTYSPEGELREDIPSLLTLKQMEGRQGVHLTLKRDAPRFPKPLAMEFTSLSRSLLFFESGAFSQGGMQFSPYSSQFGGEFALVTADRRLRSVILYNSQSELDYVTLIREQRLGSEVPERPPLQADDLVGVWEGQSVTLFPDLRPALNSTSRLEIERVGDVLKQRLQFGPRSLETEAAIEGNRLMYRNSALPVQIMMLPDGASVNVPLKPELGKPFVLETGWLRTPTLRERIMRSFDAKGEWVGLTWVTEMKVA
ncbi:DUF3598 family protein [filamentous cyanobacterium LEGE 11480]|uniref:DUF3598 family protein n=1 Tax=Romeriopsis navalis LEGE 11480 TaxID=2777977 RepID=A0A928VRE9_9CYAN|nr:DUF3598 family protein [Romeriopsis navalis]MBE9031586.1 DUF3598 family protein [Romeriopsis navalis LEGE 11480]